MEGTCIGFIGLGLIGGSIARAMRKFHPEFTLIAYNPTEAVLDAALADGVIDRKCRAQDIQFAECDYIFLCAPVSTNISYLSYLKGIMKPTCILTDVGSVKGEIHRAVQAMHLTENFIGGHPMAGSEKTGYANSTDYLIENAYYLLTPEGNVDILAVSAFSELIASLGAIPMILTYEEHDRITAAVSHLPHIVASCLVNAIRKLDTEDEYMKTIAAGGFKDITRIASSSPVMWQQICLSNQESVSAVLDEYIRLLVQAKYMVDRRESEGIYEMFDSAKDYRDSMPDSSYGPLKKVYAFYCDIYDEAGGIATIATMLAMNNISIKNIGIIHNREFEEGVLHIEFYEEDACNKAAQILRERNYNLHMR